MKGAPEESVAPLRGSDDEGKQRKEMKTKMSNLENHPLLTLT